MNAATTSAVAILVARAFESAGAPYALVGSVASSLHGEPRGTMDVDFVTLMRAQHVDRFLENASTSFVADAAWVREAVRERRLFQLVHRQSYIKVDVYVRAEEGPDASQVLRARRATLGEDPTEALNVASAEDTILQKLAWYEQGGRVSDRQWRDVVGVVKLSQDSLDHGYMSDWAAIRGLAELLQRALKSAQA